ncbi:hypothetical protein BGZ60DRAFT_428708 [Tricladium varicosporioides]|nr:hypothetical protein BGZ60DRAFT_428708 [Hymenoscyphus varicosporioides]
MCLARRGCWCSLVRRGLLSCMPPSQIPPSCFPFHHRPALQLQLQYAVAGDEIRVQLAVLHLEGSSRPTSGLALESIKICSFKSPGEQATARPLHPGTLADPGPGPYKHFALPLLEIVGQHSQLQRLPSSARRRANQKPLGGAKQLSSALHLAAATTIQTIYTTGRGLRAATTRATGKGRKRGLPSLPLLGASRFSPRPLPFRPEHADHYISSRLCPHRLSLRDLLDLHSQRSSTPALLLPLSTLSHGPSVPVSQQSAHFSTACLWSESEVVPRSLPRPDRLHYTLSAPGTSPMPTPTGTLFPTLVFFEVPHLA